MITQKEVKELRRTIEQETYDFVYKWCQEHQEYFEDRIKEAIGNNSSYAYILCENSKITMYYRDTVREAFEDFFGQYGYNHIFNYNTCGKILQSFCIGLEDEED